MVRRVSLVHMISSHLIMKANASVMVATKQLSMKRLVNVVVALVITLQQKDVRPAEKQSMGVTHVHLIQKKHKLKWQMSSYSLIIGT